jgi:hypothetical protein
MVRFACAACGQELAVHRDESVIYLIWPDEETGVGQSVTASSEVSRIRSEIQDIKDRLWTEKKGIPRESLYNFFVMLDDLKFERTGKPRTRSLMSLFAKKESSEAEIRQVLDTLTMTELDGLIAKCVRLTEKGTPMDRYREAFGQIKRLERELVRVGGRAV